MKGREVEKDRAWGGLRELHSLLFLPQKRGGTGLWLKSTFVRSLLRLR